MSTRAGIVETPQQKWQTEIVAAEKELKKFHERGRMVNRKFVDERDNMTANSKWFNIFYANVGILESSLYAQLPKPSVARKYTDYNDEVGRVAALMLERSITQDLDDPNDTFDATLRHCVQDRLVPGVAQAWLRLETDTEDIQEEPTSGSEIGDDLPEDKEPMKKITDQRICVDYVFWQDFIWSPCRVWEERRWVGRKTYMDRESLIERFKEKGKLAPLNFRPGGLESGVQTSTPKEDIQEKAIVYEIWERATKKVFWYCEGMDELLDAKDDFLGLEGFEPCPKPMLANISTSNTVPRPDYYMIQDQYTELDTINNRISMLLQACKVVGVYDKGAAASVGRMLTETYDNQLVPVDNWAMFAEKGGLKGTIDWLPLDMVVMAIRELNGAREVIKGQIYELTGIADIVRGASKASETLGAQQIKAQFASVRIKKLQDEVARFATEIMRIKAELQLKHFTPELLVKKSGILQTTGNEPYIAQAIQLLQSQDGFEWRISITADTLAQADYAMEKQDRIDFMASVSKYLQAMTPMIQGNPKAAPILLGLLKWSVAGFRGARDIEGMLDRELDAMQQQSQQPPPPSPEQLKLQAEQQAAQQAQQMEMQKMQAEMQADQQKMQMEMQQKQMEMQMEQQRLQMEMQAEQQRLAMERQSQQMALMFEKLMGELKLQLAQQQAALKLETTREQNQAKIQSAANSGD
jgi:hypothetical protein